MRIAYEKAFRKIVMLGCCIRNCLHHPHFSITSFQTQTFLKCIRDICGLCEKQVATARNLSTANLTGRLQDNC
ncbi:unnamed protein product [Amoebophrya sp. A120]|nr:unnamed protein product [Amoebophrya sp. A120]|eukprot:GSA120T00026399001.1